MTITFFTLYFSLINLFLRWNYILPILISINFFTIKRIPDSSSFSFSRYNSVCSISNCTPVFTSSIILVCLRYTFWLLWKLITFDNNIIISLMFVTTIWKIANVSYNFSSNFSPTCVCNTTPWFYWAIYLKSLRFKLNNLFFLTFYKLKNYIFLFTLWYDLHYLSHDQATQKALYKIFQH